MQQLILFNMLNVVPLVNLILRQVKVIDKDMIVEQERHHDLKNQ